eukprot:TRINITY_DN20348_c0_g1_i1.p1 TRINITY_DN20348_c0_g1~~TRINITY_DN20348_c0_g1_i1.p1  ORF type:complete len:421 (-),score=82.57 TRINITY_DN20348_c0_g1_i1:147-1409(-)
MGNICKSADFVRVCVVAKTQEELTEFYQKNPVKAVVKDLSKYHEDFKKLHEEGSKFKTIPKAYLERIIKASVEHPRIVDQSIFSVHVERNINYEEIKKRVIGPELPKKVIKGLKNLFARLQKNGVIRQVDFLGLHPKLDTVIPSILFRSLFFCTTTKKYCEMDFVEFVACMTRFLMFNEEMFEIIFRNFSTRDGTYFYIVIEKAQILIENFQRKWATAYDGDKLIISEMRAFKQSSGAPNGQKSQELTRLSFDEFKKLAPLSKLLSFPLKYAQDIFRDIIVSQKFWKKRRKAFMGNRTSLGLSATVLYEKWSGPTNSAVREFTEDLHRGGKLMSTVRDKKMQVAKHKMFDKNKSKRLLSLQKEGRILRLSHSQSFSMNMIEEKKPEISRFRKTKMLAHQKMAKSVRERKHLEEGLKHAFS